MLVCTPQVPQEHCISGTFDKNLLRKEQKAADRAKKAEIYLQKHQTVAAGYEKGFHVYVMF